MVPLNPTGPIFLCHRRVDAGEVRLLRDALHRVGVPTWLDTVDFTDDPNEAVVAAAIERCSGAVVWITPGLAASSFVGKVELPHLFDRAVDAGASLTLIAAGGLDPVAAGKEIAPLAGLHNPGSWAIVATKGSPVDLHNAEALADHVLRERVRRLHQQLPPGEPLRLRLDVRTSQPSADIHLHLDWTEDFALRSATPELWQALRRSLAQVVRAIEAEARGRAVVADGTATLSAAYCLGEAFLAPRRLSLTWLQFHRHTTTPWQLSPTTERSPCTVREHPHAPAGEHVGVVVSITNDATSAGSAWRRERAAVDDLVRCVIDVRPPARDAFPLALTPSQGMAVAEQIDSAIRNQRAATGTAIHLMLAAPTGLAVLLGQLSNTIPWVQLYEHQPGPDGGSYAPSCAFQPNGPRP
jgi:hypothetical protein